MGTVNPQIVLLRIIATRKGIPVPRFIAKARLFRSLLTCFALAFAGSIFAQLSGVDTSRQADAAAGPVQMNAKETVLSPNWHRLAGDDVHFSDPGLDDSEWPLMLKGRSEYDFTSKPFQMIWYRGHVPIPAGSHDVALFFFGFRGPEQLFVNGRMLDTWGTFGPGRGGIHELRRVIFLPNEALESGNLTIAIRAELSSSGAQPFGAETRLVLGPRSVIAMEKSLLTFRYFTSNAVQMGVEFFVLLLALALALANRTEREYLAMVFLIAVFLASDGVFTWLNAMSMQLTPQFLLVDDFFPLTAILLAELVLRTLRVQRTRTVNATYWLAAASCSVMWLVSVCALYGHSAPSWIYVPARWMFLITEDLPVFALSVFTIWFALARRNHEALLLGIPLVIDGGLSLSRILHQLSLTPDLYVTLIPTATFSMRWFEVARIFLCLTLLVVLVLRTMRIARERGVVTSELHAARTVQQMLLDNSSIVTPGFHIESAYLPASEVGGDFYFIKPAEDGSLLLIFGDVSGKGLRAAMAVSVILGALRTSSCREPGAVLQILNRTLFGFIEGFVTCCAALLESCGTLRLANAGNPNPYMDGRELLSPAELPLGLALDTSYDEVTAELRPGSRLLFASDGVMEASRSHQLFGFERTAALACESAAALAHAAQQFGQSDDITVLTIQHLTHLSNDLEGTGNSSETRRALSALYVEPSDSSISRVRRAL